MVFGRLVSLSIILLLAFVSLLTVRATHLAPVDGLLGQISRPLQWVVGTPLNTAAQVGEGIESLGDLRSENARLRRQVDELTRQASSVPDLEREVQQLREMLALRRSQPALQWLEARVILVDPDNLGRAVTINRGTHDGVQDGMTVMTARGLVGRVVRATGASAKVMLITDVSSSATSIIRGGQASGIISGQRRADGFGLVMRHITQGEPIKSDDRVVTSGLGGVFPAGILVGTVTDVRQRDTDLFQEATIEPAVDMRRLDVVYVVVNHIPVKLD